MVPANDTEGILKWSCVNYSCYLCNFWGKLSDHQLVVYTVMDIKDWTLHRAIEVKVPWLRAVPARQEWMLPLKKLIHFFLGPWLLVCQFIDISNQMETTGELSNIERIFLYNGPLYKFFLLDVWYFASWLHLIGNVCKLAH